MKHPPEEDLLNALGEFKLSDEEYSRRMLEYESERDPLGIKRGQDVRIAPTVIIKRPHLFEIGNHCAIDDFAVFTTRVWIGNYCHISYHVSVIGGELAELYMGHFSHLAAGARIICATDNHQGDGLVSPVIPPEFRDGVTCDPVMISDFATIGTNAVVMPGAIIAEGAVVGANSFVPTGMVLHAWSTYVGSPVRKIKERRSDKMIEYARKLGYNY